MPEIGSDTPELNEAQSSRSAAGELLLSELRSTHAEAPTSEDLRHDELMVVARLLSAIAGVSAMPAAAHAPDERRARG